MSLIVLHSMYIIHLRKNVLFIKLTSMHLFTFVDGHWVQSETDMVDQRIVERYCETVTVFSLN